MCYLADMTSVSGYKIEMVLLLYSIVIGFSFDIFRRERLIAFQYIVGISGILYLSGRMFSLWNQFQKQDTTGYNEIFFFLDILIMVMFYRSISSLEHINPKEETRIEAYQKMWLCFSSTMLITMVYRVVYAGFERYNIPQAVAVLYCLVGYYYGKPIEKRENSLEIVDKIQLWYSIPFFIGAIGYCVMRFRLQNF